MSLLLITLCKIMTKTEDKINIIIKKLEQYRLNEIESDRIPSKEELNFFNVGRIGTFQSVMYIPHEANYKEILEKLNKDDIVMDMGAGDLRFALLASQKVQKVYAVEMNPEIIAVALSIIKWGLPRNLVVICADWRYVEVPSEVNVITCMVNGALIDIDKWRREQ